MTDIPPPQAELDLWFAAGFRISAAAQRRHGWLYGRTALDQAASALVQLYAVGQRCGWTLEDLGRVEHADSCLEAVWLRMREGLPAEDPPPGWGWRAGLLDALDLRLQRLQVPTYRRFGALLLPPSGRAGWPVGPTGRSYLQVEISAERGWEFGVDGTRLALVVADIDDTGIEEVAALAVTVMAGRLPGPAGQWLRDRWRDTAVAGGRGASAGVAVIDEARGAAR